MFLSETLKECADELESLQGFNLSGLTPKDVADIQGQINNIKNVINTVAHAICPDTVPECGAYKASIKNSLLGAVKNGENLAKQVLGATNQLQLAGVVDSNFTVEFTPQQDGGFSANVVA